ncbi:MAG: NADAR family protein [Patescibacteria group bacterium]|nr:NADAR family protein [Patescibacteria group bacterium]
MRDSLLEMSGKVIAFYEREFYCFSNFSSFAVEWQGRLWPTSEHAYQASRFFETHPEIVEEIFKAKSAHDARKITHKYPDLIVNENQEEHIKTMEDICWHKLQQHTYIQKKLLQTADKEIVEDSPQDAFWGWGENRDGRNELGKIWMRLRDKITKK